MAYEHFPIENQVTHDCREEIKKEKSLVTNTMQVPLQPQII